MMIEKMNSLQKGSAIPSPLKSIRVKNIKVADKREFPTEPAKKLAVSSEKIQVLLAEKRGNSEKISIEQVKQAVLEVKQETAIVNSKLSFYVDEKTEKLVVKVIDKETGETIRQIPSEEMLRLAARFKESREGTLVDEKG